LGIQDYPAVFSLNGISLEDETGAQPMKFNYLRVYETVFRRLNKRLYAGGGISIDYHYKIEDQLLDLNMDPPLLTSHYLYCLYKDFPTENYSTIGFTGKLLYDNRDNSINPYKGIYLDFGFRINKDFLGSTKNSSQILIEARKYKRVGKRNNLMAFWFLGDFKLSGSIPYLALPSIGWDTYNRSGRGYLQGRFRGENMVYAETEFRYQISRSGLLGGVLFLNMITTDNEMIDQKLFDAFAFGYGAGLRIKMNKETRTNICVDIGLGQNNSSGVYFGIQEAF
jgi:outer membrane protein assembly factor BamA